MTRRLLNWKIVLTVLLVVCLAIPLTNIPKAFAWTKTEMHLPVTSGNDVDPTEFTLFGHLVAKGFGASVSAFFPVGTSEYTQTKLAFAVGELGDSWLESSLFSTDLYTPYVREMRCNVSGLYTATITPEAIFTNTGTGPPSSSFLATVLDWLGYAFLAYDIYDLLKEVFQTPPLQEWTAGGGHWQQAVVRQEQGPFPWYIVGENLLKTAGASVQSKFDVHGDTTLTIHAEADIWVQCISSDIFGNVNIWHGKSGTYSVTFQVSPCVNLPPYTPDHPEAGPPLPSNPPGTGYRGITYTFYAGATDPEGDNVYYEFDWNDGTAITRVGPFASGSRQSTTHSWAALGTYHLKVRAVDTFSFSSDWSVDYQLTVVENRAPNPPGQPSGPSSNLNRGQTYYYSTSGATDPDGDSIYYEFNWGDGQTSTYGPYSSGSPLSNVPHSWSVAGTYSVTARAKDVYNLYGNPSSPLTVTVINRAPNTPSTPYGTTAGYRCVSYTYSSSTTDPDGDNIRYQFELSGPITTRTYMTGWYPSGVTGSTTISWQTTDPPGTYYVRVHAQDAYGAWSSWSSYLTVYIYNRAPNTPSTPSGPSSGSPGTSYTYSTSTADLDGDNVCYQFDWGDGSSTTTGWYASGVTVSASHSWSYDGTYSVRVKAKDVYGDWSAWSSTRTVYITSGGGGGGGCPYVYTWDGQDYSKDNNLLPASEILNGTDTKDYYKLEQMLVPVFSSQQTSTYSLQIREFESEIDYIDQVKLIAVDHLEGTGIAVTPDGKILTYTTPASPISCVDNEGVDRLSEIATMNGDVGDVSTYFQGYKDDWLVLNFGKVTGPYAKLILRDDQKCCDVCINVQVPNPAGKWVTVEVLHPRDFWSMEAVDMSPFVPKTGDFKIRLLWTTAHRLDYVGLDTSPPTEVKLSSATPTQATHSAIGDVTALLLRDDGRCTKLVSGQQVTMTFTIPNEPQDTVRDFIFYTNGYYYTITP